MSPVSPWNVPAVSNSISFRHREVDFYPVVRFKPRYCLEVVPARYPGKLERNLVSEAAGWLKELHGDPGKTWDISRSGTVQFFFKDPNDLLVFKLAFGGFDKA